MIKPLFKVYIVLFKLIHGNKCVVGGHVYISMKFLELLSMIRKICTQKVSALVIFHLNFSTYLFLAGPPFAFRVTLIPHHIGLPKCCKHSYRNIYIYTIRFVYLNSIKNKDKNEFKWGQRTF